MNSLTHKRVWQLAWPIILSNLTIPIVGAIDTAVIGQLPGAQLIAAVALGAIMFDFLFWGFNFLKIGTSGLTSQAIGSNNHQLASEHLSRALIVGILSAGTILLLHQPFLSLMLGIYQPEDKVALATAEYFNIRIWGTPAVLINFVILGSFIALQKTRYVFFHQLLLNLINIVLDLYFVLGLGMQVKGVAIATVIANYAACAAGLIWLIRVCHASGIHIRLKAAVKNNIQSYLPLMKLNANIMVRTACLVFSFAFMAYMANKLGTLFLAANVILLHFQSIMAYGLDGFSDVTESLSGRAYGKRSTSDFYVAIKITTHWTILTAVLCTLAYMFFGHQLIGLFSIDQDVIRTASDYLPWLIVSPLISLWSFQLDGIYTGTTHSVEMRNGMLISTSLFVLCCFIFVEQWHNHGLWLAFTFFMVLRALVLAYWFPRITRSMA